MKTFVFWFKFLWSLFLRVQLAISQYWFTQATDLRHWRPCSLMHICVTWLQCVNSSPPCAAYMHQWTGSALVQIMACRLDGAKPLSELMLTYYQLDPKEHISMKFYLKFKCFHSRKCIWKCHLENGIHLVSASVCSCNGVVFLDVMLEANKFISWLWYHLVFYEIHHAENRWRTKWPVAPFTNMV